MYLTRQAQVESKEKALEAYRKERFRGSARVRLDCLGFEKGFSRLMDDGRNTVRLERILELQGCLRINRDYHVPVLVDAADWGRTIKMHDSEDELLPELAVPLNMLLRAQGYESIVAAARKMLSGPSRWWVVDVYVEDPGKFPPASLV
ncbi:uncharacterized protein LDX57_007839 [Aspergillus melleus]|uniref:uncharacterized protein n=1 Tax=Aspergillus melleus TaxID=138277 RepID=UPI001E8E4A3E|nr:uncharacterized protein LDX57_007839 [Aspergillus melleus]KAH8430169.1 hypothetical protein LDX57_007839 [Aspergillus melleus]